ncbi:MAG: phage major capsid protein [Pseudonocardia sp.]
MRRTQTVNLHSVYPLPLDRESGISNGVSNMTNTLPTAAALRDRPAGWDFRQHLDAVRTAMTAHLAANQSLTDGAAIAGRSLLASEQREFDQHDDEIRRLGVLVRQVENSPEARTVDRSQIISASTDLGSGTREAGRVLGPDQRIADWSAQRSGQRLASGHVWAGSDPLPGHTDQSDLSLGMFLRGWVTTRWDGAEREHRALNEGTSAGGGVTVPEPLATEIIDRARNFSRVIQAGARTIPMTSQTLRVPRIAGSPNPAWRAENAAIAESDLTFDSVTFTARSMALLVRCSRELLEDGQDIDGIVRDDLAQQVALEIDRIMLRGTGAAPEPRGVRNTSGVTITQFGGANGAIPASYDHLLDGVQAVRAGNFAPTAVIENPRTATTMSKLREDGATGAYLAPPVALAGMPILTTNQVPANLTVGTSTDCSEIYIGDWSKCWLGIRTELQLTTLVERYADLGQVAFLCWYRADVQLSQPGAFHVHTGIRG